MNRYTLEQRISVEISSNKSGNEKLKQILSDVDLYTSALLQQPDVSGSLPHPVEFGRWLLKYCEPAWEEGLLTWSYQGELIDTKELYEVFEAMRQ